MLEEKSCGVVVFRRENDSIVYLLLHYPSGHWDFPKGKMEIDENPKQTAVREVMEETGIKELRFVDEFEEKIEYNFQHSGIPIHKQVTFFLAETLIHDVTLSHEHQNFIWLNYDDAMKKITFDNAKLIITKANKLLSKSLIL